MNETPREISLLSRAHKALSQARTIDEVKDLRDKADAVRAYAQKAKLGQHIVVEAATIKVQAQRKLGQMLQQVQLAKASQGNQYTAKMDQFQAGTGPIMLKDLGISKSDSSRSQRIASLPEPLFQQYLKDSTEANREPTTASLLKLAKQHSVNHQEVETTTDRTTDSHMNGMPGIVNDLSQLITKGCKYRTIYADPPWPYNNQATRAATSNHYRSMTLDQICEEPVSELTLEQAHLHLWTTNCFLPVAFDVLDAWGFEYKSCFIWVKPQIGIGNYWRVSHEFLLLGVRGSLTFRNKSQRSWIEVDRTRVHSRKPDVVRQMIEEVSPAPYLEMYGREKLPKSDWTVYGNQVKTRLP